MTSLLIDPQPANFPDLHRFEVSSPTLGRYDIMVALPPCYAESSTRHPIIYLTDGPHFFWNVLGTMRFLGIGQMVPAAIIVAVGYPADEGLAAGWAFRRHYDYSPGPWDMSDELGTLLKQALLHAAQADGRPDIEVRAGGAEEYLAFLRDQLDPAIRAAYRCDDSKPTLVGASAGGAFVLYALFSGVSPFDKYICMSPAVGFSNRGLYQMEAEYARSHQDLKARVFLCAGDEEMTAGTMALAEVASGVVRLTELLTVRQYPSLGLKSQLMNGESHVTLHPRALLHGLLHVYAPPAKP